MQVALDENICQMHKCNVNFQAFFFDNFLNSLKFPGFFSSKGNIILIFVVPKVYMSDQVQIPTVVLF